MSYKELQEKAKSLGLSYVGVSADKLEKDIKEAEVKKEESKDKSESLKKTSPEEKLQDKEKKEDTNYNAAIVYDTENREVRRYTLAIHGEDFADKANQFISHQDRANYIVKLVEVKPGIICPSCGYEIHLDSLGR